jgi:aminocarboxymuconate-semialdehyde decarboxylase
MTTRRQMLGNAGALAGLAFIQCGLVPGASAQPEPRREVVINGKRVRTIDCHAHCHVPEALALTNVKENYPALVVSADRIKVMDEQGIDVEVLSLNPIFWYKTEPDLAARIVKL